MAGACAHLRSRFSSSVKESGFCRFAAGSFGAAGFGCMAQRAVRRRVECPRTCVVANARDL